MCHRASKEGAPAPQSRLEQAEADFRLASTIGWHIRHGVDTSQGLALLNAGITSHCLAHQIGHSAQSEGISGDRLRLWPTQLHLSGRRNRFAATAYEALELLEYVRMPSASLIGSILAQLEVTTTLAGLQKPPGTRVQIVTADGPTPALWLVVDEAEVLATVPAGAHLDLNSIIDTGIEFERSLVGTTLNLRLPTGE